VIPRQEVSSFTHPPAFPSVHRDRQPSLELSWDRNLPVTEVLLQEKPGLAKTDDPQGIYTIPRYYIQMVTVSA
jgi:hypothetical protein